MNATPRECMAVFISRQIRDGEFVVVGTNSPVARAGVLLAHYRDCPNLQISMGGGTVTNFAGREPPAAFAFSGDPRALAGAESFLAMDFENLRRYDLFFIGGMQVDPYGNTNLIGVGADYPRLKVRGPGTIGTASLSAEVRRYCILLNAHDRRTLVSRLDYRSGVGWGDGGEDGRNRLRLPGGGPQYVITPLAVFDFAPGTRRMRLRQLMPGVTAEEVVGNMGFAPEPGPPAEPVAAPTPAELSILRGIVDAEGALRRPGA